MNRNLKFNVDARYCISTLILFLFLCSNAQAGSEIVVSAQSAVYCLNPGNGSLRWSYPHPAVDDGLHIWEQSGPAIGNLDGLDYPEVVFGADKLYCLNGNDGSLVWSYTPSSSAFWVCNPAIVNIDTTGDAEILAATLNYLYCMNSNGTVKWSYPISATYIYPWAGPAVTAEDIDGDGLPEALVVSASKVYCLSSTGSLKWSNSMSSGEFETGIAIADVDADAAPEIIVTVSHENLAYIPYIYCFSASGSQEWLENVESGLVSNPAIADVNNDGTTELVAHYSEPTNQSPPCNGSEVVVFKKHSGGAYLDRLWGCSTTDWTAVSTTCPILCGIDGDVDKDIFWVGCSGFPGHSGTLYIFNGTNSSTVGTSNYFASETINEHSVSIADIDDDGYAEIVGIDTTLSGVSVIESDGSWANTRDLWTSHLYHITDINDDVTVPRKEAQSWKSHNSWLTQSTTGGSGYGTPTLKWTVLHPEFGNIYASIAIAPLGPLGSEESQAGNKRTNPQITYEGNNIVLTVNLDRAARISYQAFDITGRLTMKQNSAMLEKGQHKLSLDLEGCKNGIYFIQVDLGKVENPDAESVGESFTRKIVLIK